MKQPRVILAVTNDLNGDQRLHRIASTLDQAGYRVRVVGREKPESRPLPLRTYQQHRLRLPFVKGIGFYLSYNLALWWYLLRHPSEVITANDLDTLPGAYLAARWGRRTLVYDSHEYFTEVPELVSRPRIRQVWLTLERWLFPRLSTVYTVNHSLARIYEATYQLPVAVIRNVPFPRAGSPRQAPPRILLYQGALNLGRGLDLMIDAMAHLPGYTLWIVGSGDLAADLHTQADLAPWRDRIVFHGFMDPDALAQLTPQAGLGLSLEADLGANYHYASPNKVYDYVQARLPILVSDLPEMRAIVEQYQVGQVLPLDQRTPEALADRVRLMLEDPAAYAQWAAAAHEAAQTLNWEAERHRLIDLYAQAT
jgi:glycosyltransferase involved in cell wall biosynthesis